MLRSRSIAVEVVQGEECVAMMKEFMWAHPQLWNKVSLGNLAFLASCRQFYSVPGHIASCWKSTSYILCSFE